MLLDASDANANVSAQENGELLLRCAGEVNIPNKTKFSFSFTNETLFPASNQTQLHLERCVSDLKRSFCKNVEFEVSPPLVPMRESLSDAPRKKNTVVRHRTVIKRLNFKHIF